MEFSNCVSRYVMGLESVSKASVSVTLVTNSIPVSMDAFPRHAPVVRMDDMTHVSVTSKAMNLNVFALDNSLAQTVTLVFVRYFCSHLFGLRLSVTPKLARSLQFHYKGVRL